jgi:outer membrane receptor protein involved in Fe transport
MGARFLLSNWVGIGSLTIAMVFDAAAQDREVGPSTEQEPERVEITGPKDVDGRRESTTAKIVVTHDDIVRYGDSTVADVLRRLPGVTIGSAGEIRMRGLGSGYTQILLNGEPMPPGFSRAATADLSAQAIAGTINIVLKKTVQRAQRELKMGVAEERHRPSLYLNGQLSDRDGAFSYTLAGALSREKHDRPELAETIGSDAQRNQNLARITALGSTDQLDTISLVPRLNWTLANGDTLSSESLIQYREVEANFRERTTTVLGAPPTYASVDLPFHSDSTLVRSKLNWVQRLADSAKLDVKFGISHSRRDSVAKLEGTDNDGVFLLDRTVRSSATDRGLTSSGKYLAPYAQRHSLEFGWDGEYSQRGENRIQRDITPTGLPPNNLDEIYDTRVRRLAVFAQDEWQIIPRWSAYLGLRWEGLDTRSVGNVLSKTYNRFGVWSPVLQTVWKLPGTANDQVRLGLTRTYKAPLTTELIPRRYIANNNSAVTPDFQGNPELRPELAWGLDGAYEHYLGASGVLSASAFARRIDDVTVEQLTNVNGIWITRPVNAGRANVRGIELDAKFDLHALFHSAPAIDVRANLARNWSSVDAIPGPNNRLNRQTPISANFGLDYAMDGTRLTLGGNFSFQSGGPVRLSTTQSAYTKPRRTLDLYGLWKFDPETQLRVSLANVLHQDNVATATYFDDTGMLQRTATTPTSTVARATLELRF